MVIIKVIAFQQEIPFLKRNSEPPGSSKPKHMFSVFVSVDRNGVVRVGGRLKYVTPKSDTQHQHKFCFTQISRSQQQSSGTTIVDMHIWKLNNYFTHIVSSTNFTWSANSEKHCKYVSTSRILFVVLIETSSRKNILTRPNTKIRRQKINNIEKDTTENQN